MIAFPFAACFVFFVIRSEKLGDFEDLPVSINNNNDNNDNNCNNKSKKNNNNKYIYIYNNNHIHNHNHILYIFTSIMYDMRRI